MQKIILTIFGIYFLFTFASAIFDLNLTEQLPSWVHIAVIGAGIGMIVINLIKGQILAARGDNGRQPSLNRDDMVGVSAVSETGEEGGKNKSSHADYDGDSGSGGDGGGGD